MAADATIGTIDNTTTANIRLGALDHKRFQEVASWDRRGWAPFSVRAPGRPRSCASQPVERERDGQTAKVGLRSSISNAIQKPFSPSRRSAISPGRSGVEIALGAFYASA